MKHIYVIVAAFVFAGCGDIGPSSSTYEETADMDIASGYIEREFSQQKMGAPAPAPSPGQSEPSEPSGIFLAYRYGYGVELPARAVKYTADKHMEICQNAGLSKCQIMGSSANGNGDSNVRASLSLRAEPEWLER